MERTYDETIAELEGIKILSRSKRKPNYIYSDDFRSFFIRGTRFFVEIKRERSWPGRLSGSKSPKETAVITWYFKTRKFKKKLVIISFEELLESEKLGDKAKAELIFNIDLFRS